MLTFQYLPYEIRLYILSFACTPDEVNVCALLRAQHGWHSPTTYDKAKQQHEAPVHWISPNLNLLLVSHQFHADARALISASPAIDIFLCHPWCTQKYIKHYSSVEEPAKVAQQARQHPRVAWSQRNIRRIRYLYPNKFMHRQLFSWKGTDEEAETLMRRTLGLWWGWRYVKVKMTDKIEDEEGKQIWSPSMDVLLENKVMVRKGKTP